MSDEDKGNKQLLITLDSSALIDFMVEDLIIINKEACSCVKM